ncbi:hypothetical protein DMC47_39960 [Nostoc sp. 3335mG]|nr:hypothetical protein DMC47_39960 [Nostoc sp. 3335mG]
MGGHMIGRLVEWWTALDVEIQSAMIGAGATILTVLGGLCLLIIQLRSQASQTREAIQEGERRKLKAEMFAEGAAAARSLVDQAIELQTAIRSMTDELLLASAAGAANLGFPTPKARFLSLLRKHEEFSDAALRFIFLVENRRFIDTRIIVFRSAISDVLDSLRNAIFREFSQHIMPLLPVDAVDGSTFPYTPPKQDSVRQAISVAKPAIQALDDAIAYGQDFTVELQNRLLGDLFGSAVEHRVPLDPASKVISLDHFDELERYFHEETPSGRNRLRISEEIARRFREPASEKRS